MTRRAAAFSVATASLIAGATSAIALAAAPAKAKPPPPPKANPCLEVKNCKVTAGPWVAVPATGEATFLLECPKRTGTIGGTDALASSTDVRVSVEWNATLGEGLNAGPGSPIRPGTTTAFLAFFHAYSGQGKPGLFQPYIGCIPEQKVKPRSRLSARVTPRITRPGAYLIRRQDLFELKSGSQTQSEGCGKGERLLSGWYAVVFGSEKAPDPALGAKVHVSLSRSGGRVVALAQTDSGVPAAAHVQLQVGAVCSK